MKKRAGWTRLSAPGDKCRARWVHNASRWIVMHCGHPTANWPYYLAGDPVLAHGAELVVSFNGLGFQTLEAAMSVVERIVAGELTVTRERCEPGVARVLVDAAGVVFGGVA